MGLRLGDPANKVMKSLVLSINMMHAREHEFMIRCGDRCIVQDK
jgi:hypothetical protein